MKSRKRPDGENYGRLLDTDQLCSYLSMGKNSAVQIASEAGSKRKFGRSARYDRAILDAWLSKTGTTELSDGTSDKKTK